MKNVLLVNALLLILFLSDNWLRVLGTTERSQVDQRVRHQLHAIVPLLDTFKPTFRTASFILVNIRP